MVYPLVAWNRPSLIVLQHVPGYLEPKVTWLLEHRCRLVRGLILKHPLPQRWFYKGVVDGMMLLRFLYYIYSASYETIHPRCSSNCSAGAR